MRGRLRIAAAAPYRPRRRLTAPARVCTHALVLGALVLGPLALSTPPAGAGELEDLRDTVRVLQKTMAAQRRAFKSQQQTIDALTRRLDSISAAPRGDTTTPAEDVAEVRVEVEALSQGVSDIAAEALKATQVHLYGTLNYTDFDKQNSTFDARNIDLVINAKPHPAVRLGTEIEFEGTAQTSAGPRQGEVEVEQTWMELGLHRALNLRGGIILVPFGGYNLDHFDSDREFVDRPMVARRIVPTTWSEAGFGFTGKLPRRRNMQVQYQAYAINGLTNRLSDTSPRGARGAFRADNNDSKAVVGRAVLTLPGSHDLGLSGYYGDYDGDGRSLVGVDVDWHLRRQGFELRGEYAYFSLEDGIADSGLAAPSTLQGLYTQVSYSFWPSVLRGTWMQRRFPDSRLTTAIRWGFGRIDDDGDTGTGKNFERRLSLGFNYRPLPTFVLKAEYQFNDTRREALEHGDADGVLLGFSAAF